MPTILLLLGWRLFFYSNESNEPMHVHCRKGQMECKFWIDEHGYDIRAAYAYGLSPKDEREIRKIIFDHFDLIANEWNVFQQRRLQ